MGSSSTPRGSKSQRRKSSTSSSSSSSSSSTVAAGATLPSASSVAKLTVAPADSSSSSSSASSSSSPSPSPPIQQFISDEEISQSRAFFWMYYYIRIFMMSIHGYLGTGFDNVPKDKASLFYTDIMSVLICYWINTGKVGRGLFHRLVIASLPSITKLGGVAGARTTAVALLKQGHNCAVIPGGAEEGCIGRANAYRVVWPKKRTGFATVAVDAGAQLVPFFVRNGEESRFMPLHEVWSMMRGYVLYEWILNAQIPYIGKLLIDTMHGIWLFTSFIAIPIPVRCTAIFAPPVPYTASDSNADIVDRCHTALQSLIDEHQPNAKDGRNYMRALKERWVEEWSVNAPTVTKAIERITPAPVKRYLNEWARVKIKCGDGRGSNSPVLFAKTVKANKRR